MILCIVESIFLTNVSSYLKGTLLPLLLDVMQKRGVYKKRLMHFQTSQLRTNGKQVHKVYLHYSVVRHSPLVYLQARAFDLLAV